MADGNEGQPANINKILKSMKINMQVVVNAAAQASHRPVIQVVPGESLVLTELVKSSFEFNVANPINPQSERVTSVSPVELAANVVDPIELDAPREMTITLVKNSSHYKSVLGAVFIDPKTDALQDVQILFANTADPEMLGKSISLHDLKSVATVVSPGHRVEFFLIANGYANNPIFYREEWQTARFNFQCNNQTSRYKLIYVNANGQKGTMDGTIYQVFNDSQNEDGLKHVLFSEGDSAGELIVGVEDLPGRRARRDFNDVMFRVSVGDAPLMKAMPTQLINDVRIEATEHDSLFAAQVKLEAPHVGDCLVLSDAFSVNELGHVLDAKLNYTGVSVIGLETSALTLSGIASTEVYEELLRAVLLQVEQWEESGLERSVVYQVTDVLGQMSDPTTLNFHGVMARNVPLNVLKFDGSLLDVRPINDQNIN